MAEGELRITNKMVERLKPGEVLWDAGVAGFGVRCQARAKVYVLKVRVHGRQRWFTIGRHGSPWTPERARRQAKVLLGKINDGADISTLRSDSEQPATIADLSDRYLREHAYPHKKRSSALEDERNIRNYIVPHLGRRRVADLSLEDVEAFQRAVFGGHGPRNRSSRPADGKAAGPRRGGPYVANRCLALLSKMLNLAEGWKLRARNSNPVLDVKKFEESGRERFLTQAELERLGAVLADAERDGTENRFVIAAITLLLLTGARLNEILTLRWDYIDRDRGIIFLPDSKTGRKPIYLPPAAQSYIDAIPRLAGNPYVIAGQKEGHHLVNLQKPWRRIRARAGLDGVRIHDLRHSFASTAINAGVGLPIIKALLGHRKAATTERYAHLAADPVRAANEEIGEVIAAAMFHRPKVD